MIGSNISTCDAVLENTELLQDTHEPVLYIIEESLEFNFMDNSCQTDDTYESSGNLKAEMNIMKGTYQVELNKFANFISRKEDEITKKEGENSKHKQQIKQQDSKIRCLEREIRHKDNDLELLRRKLRDGNMNWERRRRYMFVEEDKENDETCEKKKKSVAKETVLVVTLFNFCIYCKICFLLKGGEVISTLFIDVL
jgi:predicted RNase H-like nuclease (RuvC/YqgF family)